MKNWSLIIISAILLFLGNACGHKNETSPYKYDDFKTIHPDFKLSSEAVVDGKLNEDFKCEEKVNGVENSIPLSWANVPEGTKSLAIVMYHYPKKDDKSEMNSYLLLWGINPSITEIPYKMANNPNWFMGSNKDGTAISYTSPCSHGPGAHEYTIALFALSETPKSLPEANDLDVDLNKFIAAISDDKIIDITTLTFIDAKPL